MTAVHCIYHAGCPDGFTSFWAVNKRYGRHYVIGHEGRYGTPPPFDKLPEGCDLIIVDFSYPRDQMIELAHHVGSLWVFDHHQTAEADLAGLETELSDANVRVVFDMERSGAGITWDELFTWANGASTTWEEVFGSAQRPVLLDFVEARDLWRMDEPDVPEIGAFIMTLEHDLDVWDEAMARPQSELREMGKGALAQRQQFCRAILEHSYHAVFELHHDTGREWHTPWRMPVVNVSYPIGSESAQALMEHHETDAAAYYFQRADGTWQYGFRSRNDVDVSLLAQALGGGGHKHAAGAQGFPSPIHRRAS